MRGCHRRESETPFFEVNSPWVAERHGVCARFEPASTSLGDANNARNREFAELAEGGGTSLVTGRLWRKQLVKAVTQIAASGICGRAVGSRDGGLAAHGAVD